LENTFKMSSSGYCSLCFTHVQSALHFPAHALICAGGGKKRGVREPDYEVVHAMILADQLDDVRVLLENGAVPGQLVSIQYARSVEMCWLLIQFGASRFEYIGDGKVALEEAAKWFNIREFLPRYRGIANGFVEKLVALRDAHYALRDADPSEPFQFQMGLVSSGSWPEAGQFLTDDGSMTYDVPRPDLTYKREFLYEMVYNGFFPVEAGGVGGRILEDLYFQRYSELALSFWTRLVGGPWGFLKGIWVTSTLNTILQGVSQNPASFKLLIAGQFHLVFKKSTRAKTDMSLFRTMDSKTIAQPEPNTVPVTRYAAGMSRGLYFNDDEEEEDSSSEHSKEESTDVFRSLRKKPEYCGTFYYREPESNAYLKYGRALVAKDKSEALANMIYGGKPRVMDSFQKLVLRALETYDKLDLMFTPSEFVTFVKKVMSDDTLGKRVDNVIELPSNVENMLKDMRLKDPVVRDDTRRYYCGHVLGVYAAEDDLDQAICRNARAQGYDIIILERMVGSRQLVTEVLDVRSREESFKNLYFLKED
jgi:hypothetical protein